jgi:hypothetical protein
MPWRLQRWRLPKACAHLISPLAGEIGSFRGGANLRNLGKRLLAVINQLDAAHGLR